MHFKKNLSPGACYCIPFKAMFYILRDKGEETSGSLTLLTPHTTAISYVLIAYVAVFCCKMAMHCYSKYSIITHTHGHTILKKNFKVTTF